MRSRRTCGQEVKSEGVHEGIDIAWTVEMAKNGRDCILLSGVLLVVSSVREGFFSRSIARLSCIIV